MVFTLSVIFLLSVFSHTSCQFALKDGYDHTVATSKFCDKGYECQRHHATRHTICRHKCKLNRLCKEFVAYKLDNNRRQYILDLHNFYRNALAAGNETRAGGFPTVADMRILNYNLTYEPLVYCEMKDCRVANKYKECRRLIDYNVAQNRYMIQAVKDDIHTLIDGYHIINSSVVSWFEELVVYNERNNNETHDNDAVLQLLYSNASEVGCGIVRFTAQYTSWHTWMFFCNYGPSYEDRQQDLYLRGKPASNCPEGSNMNEEYNNLCGTLNLLDKNRQKIVQQVGDNVSSHTPPKEVRIKIITHPPGIHNVASQICRWSIALLSASTFLCVRCIMF